MRSPSTGFSLSPVGPPTPKLCSGFLLTTSEFVLEEAPPLALGKQVICVHKGQLCLHSITWLSCQKLPTCGWQRVHANSTGAVGEGLSRTQKPSCSSTCLHLGFLAWLICKATGFLMLIQSLLCSDEVAEAQRSNTIPSVSHSSWSFCSGSEPQKSHAGEEGNRAHMYSVSSKLG